MPYSSCLFVTGWFVTGWFVTTGLFVMGLFVTTLLFVTTGLFVTGGGEGMWGWGGGVTWETDAVIIDWMTLFQGHLHLSRTTARLPSYSAAPDR